jgi:chromosome segregation ATPase
MIKALLNYQENDKKLFEIEMKLATSEERKKAVSARKYLESVDENLTKLDLRAGELDFVLKTAIKEKEKLKEELQDVKTVSSGIESREEAEFIVKKIEKIVTAIKKVSDEIRNNIHEAREKINTAYLMKDKDRGVADWYKHMAAAHLEFNSNGHNCVTRLISEAKAEKHDDPLLPGMAAVYEEIHADIIREAAEVQAMINGYK